MFVMDTYYVPAELAAKLATGEFVRYGNVIKYASGAAGSKGGQVVTWLKKSNTVKDAANAARNAAAAVIKTPLGKAFVVVGTALIVYTVADGVYERIQMSKFKKSCKNFNTSISNYFNALAEGSLNDETLNQLLTSTQDLNSYDCDIVTEFTSDELNTLMSILAGYTEKMISANKADEAISVPSQANYDSSIIWLEDILKTQKELSHYEDEQDEEYKEKEELG